MYRLLADDGHYLTRLARLTLCNLTFLLIITLLSITGDKRHVTFNWQIEAAAVLDIVRDKISLRDV